MRKILTLLGLFFLTANALQAQSKQFHNLTANDVKIDSIMPHVALNYELPADHLDSIYTVILKYPEFMDMSAADIEAYRNLTDALPPEMPEVETATVYSRKKASLVAGMCPVVYRNGKFQWLVSFMTELQAKSNSQKTRMRRAETTGAAGRYATKSVLSSGSWAKIRVTKSGIHQITSDVISKAGFNDLSKVKVYGYGGELVPEQLTDEYLREHDDLSEVPTYSANGKKYFFARGPVSWNTKTEAQRTQNPYSDYGYYFITQNDGAAKSISHEQLLELERECPATYHNIYEKDEFAWKEAGRRLFENTEITQGKSLDYYIGVPNGNLTAKITVATSGVTPVSTDGKSMDGYLEVLINDSLVGKQRITIGTYDCANSAITTWNVLKNLRTENKITIRNTNLASVHLDYICSTFTRPDLTTDVNSREFPTVEYVHNITNQNLHADGAYDMVIIIPTSQKLKKQAEELKTLHETMDGLRVRIVPADELYNEFSSGTPDVSAYRRYMKMLYDRATTETDQPRYLLLFGSCVWDNRMKTSTTRSFNPDDYLLCFESENSFSEKDSYVSDDFLGMLDDNETISTGSSYLGIPDIGVGRLPVTTASIAQGVVNKIKHYATNSCDGPWQNTILFLGDDGNNNIHMIDINDVADTLYVYNPGFYEKKVMWDSYNRVSTSTGNRYPDVANIIKKTQNSGALIIDYAGHGAPNSMSHEYVASLTDFENFKGKNYSFWVTATCDISPFDGTRANIGTTAVLNPNGGSIGFYGTNRTVLSNYNKYINRTFIRSVIANDKYGRLNTIGDANRAAKDSLVTRGFDRSVNKLQYNLIGDPALRLAVPRLTVTVDSINGIAADSNAIPVMKAGSIATIVGHIGDGTTKLNDFNGLVNIIVNDTKQTITCKLNNTTSEGATKPFVYTDYANTLFQGTDSIKNGQFKFTFALTKDINYSDGFGLITLHAMNNQRNLAGHGAYSRFNIIGGEMVENDSIGPSIYCYLNTSDFTNGGTVNSTPFFVAEISDEDGLNASGSGIGHDLQLTIDGQANLTYTLNDNFQFDFGSYTKGQTYYSIPRLSPGAHTLKFRAWDIHNNPSTATLNFNVQASVSPTLTNLYALPNPASDSVTFVINHDRPGAELEVTLDVMDASGRLLWTTTDKDSNDSNSYTYTWNLCLDNGEKLNTGIYLYRARVSSDGSEETSKAKKLIVVRK